MDTPSNLPPILDYGTPATEPAPVFSIRLFFTGCLMVLGSSLMNLYLVPIFETMHKDYNTQLPAIITAVFWIARNYVWVGFWLLPPLMGFIPRLLHSKIASPSRRRTIQYILIRSILVLLLLLPILLLFISYAQLIYAVAN